MVQTSWGQNICSCSCPHRSGHDAPVNLEQEECYSLLCNFLSLYEWEWAFPNDSAGEEPACNAGDAVDLGSIPSLERSPGGGNGNPLQYFCLKNPMDRGTWQATVHDVSKSQTQLGMHALS